MPLLRQLKSELSLTSGSPSAINLIIYVIISPMTKRLKLTTVGSSVGIILPKDMLARLRVEKGDTLFAVETPEGYSLTRHNEEFARQMEIAEKVMRENYDVLRELAK